jgi:hypothetical protein
MFFGDSFASTGVTASPKRRETVRRPGEAVVTLTLLLIVFFMVEGFAKLVFSITIRPLPNWGWVFGKRHYWNTAVFLSVGEPHHDSNLVARCVAWDTAYLRRGGSQLAGVAGASELIGASIPFGLTLRTAGSLFFRTNDHHHAAIQTHSICTFGASLKPAAPKC